jgi:hypothetical protein
MTVDQAVDSEVVQFVSLGQRVSTNFTVNLGNRATFDAVMATAMGGNNFDPHAVATSIGSVLDDAMSVEFGAERSPVLYIEVPFFTHQRLAAPKDMGMGPKYTDAQRQAFARRVIDWARTMLADEITVQQYPVTPEPADGEPGEHPYRIRIWWD